MGSGPLQINTLAITDHLKAHGHKCSLVRLQWLSACQSTSQALPLGEFAITLKALLLRPPGGCGAPPGTAGGNMPDPSGSRMGGEGENSQSQLLAPKTFEGCWFTLTGASLSGPDDQIVAVTAPVLAGVLGCLWIWPGLDCKVAPRLCHADLMPRPGAQPRSQVPSQVCLACTSLRPCHGSLSGEADGHTAALGTDQAWHFKLSQIESITATELPDASSAAAMHNSRAAKTGLRLDWRKKTPST